MTKTERQTISKSRARIAAEATTERLAMVGGGYFAGRQMRNSEIQGQPAALVFGAVGLVGYRRASRGASRMAMAALIGAGCYGAGKMGEAHGEEAGNDGNLFSWSSGGGVNLD